MTPDVKAAYERFKAAQDAFFETLFTTEPVTPAAPTSTAARVPARVTRTPLPASTMPAKSGTTLSEGTRAKNLPAAVDVAVKIMKVIGADNPQLVPGVTGQLAIERIPYDTLLVQQAIDAARGKL